MGNEDSGWAGQMIDGTETVKVQRLSAWTGSVSELKTDIGSGCCSSEQYKGPEIPSSFHRMVWKAAPVPWKSDGRGFKPQAASKQSSDGRCFPLRPQTKDKQSLSCQIGVFRCSEVHEKMICIIQWCWWALSFGGGGRGGESRSQHGSFLAAAFTCWR